jgi:DNA-binding response OmpR family regulator
VFVSGYYDDVPKMRHAGHAYLCKPFRQREFLAMVREQLTPGK